jgi:putative phosphoribosyl transferase
MPLNPPFDNRHDAGRKLAEKLTEYASEKVVVMGIPNGGMAVALGVALALKADLDLVISRKLPLPLSPEGGFGSLTDDGTVILDEEIVRRAGLNERQINYQVSQVRQNIRSRSLLYHRDQPPVAVSGRTVIIVDDGLASGYTMKAAIASLRRRNPTRIVAAAPVGPQAVIREIEKVADRVVTCAVSDATKFYVADYYKQWRDVTDDEVLACLKEWRMRRSGQNIELPDQKMRADMKSAGVASRLRPIHRLRSGPGR